MTLGALSYKEIRRIASDPVLGCSGAATGGVQPSLHGRTRPIEGAGALAEPRTPVVGAPKQPKPHYRLDPSVHVTLVTLENALNPPQTPSTPLIHHS